MKDPIEKKGTYDSTIYLDGAALSNIFSRLNSLKFDHVRIIIPKEEDKIRGKTYELQEFLNLQKDFSAVIISAENKQKKETLKILIKNKVGKKKTFPDETFPYVSSDTNDPVNKYNLFVSTYDPIRTNGLHQFMIDFLKEYAKGSTQLFLTVIGICMLGTGLVVYGRRLEQSLLFISLIAMLVIILIGLMVLPKRGLYLKSDTPDPSLPLAVQELKKGWLVLIVSAIVGLLMGLLGNYIARVLHLG